MKHSEKNKYIYDIDNDSFITFTTEEDLHGYIETHNSVYLYDEKIDSWTSYPSQFAYKIMLGKLSHESFINSIKQNLMMANSHQ